MAQICRVCQLDFEDRLKLEKEVISGKAPKAAIGQKYGVTAKSIIGHMRRHVEQGLVEYEEGKELNHTETLSNEIRKLIDDAKKIFYEARKKKQNGVALKAIDSQTGVFKLLLNIATELRKRDEFRLEQSKHDELVQNEDIINDGLSKLSQQETRLYFDLLNKMMSNNPDTIQITGYGDYQDFSDVVGLTKDVVIEEAEEVEEETNERPKLKRTTDPYDQFRYKPITDEPLRREKLSAREKRQRDKNILRRIRKL